MNKLLSASELVLELGGRARVARHIELASDGTLSFEMFDGKTWIAETHPKEDYESRLGMKLSSVFKTEDGSIAAMATN